MGYIVEFSRRGVVAVSGPDAEKFLDGIITNDLAGIPSGGAGYGGLLTPQGKVLFDFIVFRDGKRFLFDLPRSTTADFAKRLGFYKLRADIEIGDFSETHRVAASWGNAHAPPVVGLVAADPRQISLGYRIIVAANRLIAITGYALANERTYDAHRIAVGVPEAGLDFTYGEVFPHDVDMDQLSGVAFDKGCYIGQEVVSRMEHRGTARRRIVCVAATSPILPAGAEIVAGEKPVGVTASSLDNAGLALVRLDRVKEALDAGVPLLVRDIPVEIAIPDWARFRLPDADVTR